MVELYFYCNNRCYSKTAVSESWEEQLGHTIIIFPDVVSNLVEGIGGVHSADKVLGYVEVELCVAGTMCVAGTTCVNGQLFSLRRSLRKSSSLSSGGWSSLSSSSDSIVD